MSFYPPLRNLPEPKRKRASEGLIRLKDSFSQNGFPQKRVDGNLLLAAWNIREFGGNKYGGRDDEPLYYLAEIISQFDLVALQEIRDDLADLQRVMQILGGWWKVLFTDVTAGKRGNKERTGFLYDSRKITFGGLAGEIVLPPIEGNEGGPAEQLARTPMIVGFRAGWFKFTICTAHLYYGKSKPDDPRRPSRNSGSCEVPGCRDKDQNRLGEKYDSSRRLQYFQNHGRDVQGSDEQRFYGATRNFGKNVERSWGKTL